MPLPVSVTAMHTYCPGATSACLPHSLHPDRTLAVSIVSLPPCGMASRALTAGSATNSSWLGSALVPDAAPAGFDRDLLAKRTAAELCHVSNQLAASIGARRSGCRREKASNRWVRPAARVAAPGSIIFVEISFAFGETPAQEVEPSDHDREHVVEVMRDAAGELADRLHLLGMPQLLLGRDFLRQVPREHVEQVAAAPGEARSATPRS